MNVDLFILNNYKLGKPLGFIISEISMIEILRLVIILAQYLLSFEYLRFLRLQILLTVIYEFLMSKFH